MQVLREQPVRESTGKRTERAAVGVLRVKEGDGARGIITSPKANRATVAEILEAVATDYRLNNLRSLDSVERRIKLHLGPVFGNWNAASVTDDQVREFIIARQAAHASNAEINRELAILRRAYARATSQTPPAGSMPSVSRRAK